MWSVVDQYVFVLLLISQSPTQVFTKASCHMEQVRKIIYNESDQREPEY